MVRVFVVDDDPSVLGVVSAVLMVDRPWIVETCASGVEAQRRLDDLEQPCPDVIVLDVVMPDLSGFELLTWLRRHRYRYDVPVVMLTALTGAADELEGWYRECDGYVRKPFEPEELGHVLAAVLAAGPELRVRRRQERLAQLLSPVHASVA